MLDVAYATFAEEGLAVPIGRDRPPGRRRRRHGLPAFPNKEALFGAIASNRLQQLTDQATGFADTLEPGAAFFAYLDVLVAEGGSDQGLMDALAGVGFDVLTAFPEAEQRFMGLLGDLLSNAQRVGAVRPDIVASDVKALLVGCQAMQRSSADPASAHRTLAVVRDGLAPRPSTS